MAKFGRRMRNAMARKFGRQCVYCKRLMYFVHTEFPTSATIEHIKRFADGGLDTPNNRVLACKLCNSMRGNRTFEEWKAKGGCLSVIPGTRSKYCSITYDVGAWRGRFRHVGYLESFT